MLNIITLKTVAATLALACVAIATNAQYSYFTLDYPGADNTYIRAISGQTIVGYYSIGNRTNGFIYDGGSFSSISYPGAQATYAEGVSGSKVVGFVSFGGIAQNTYGFVYDGGFTDLNGTQLASELQWPLSTLVYLRPMAISGGTIVGAYEFVVTLFGYQSQSGSFQYDGTTYTNFNYWPHPQEDVANGMSQGTIVGTYSDYRHHGFIYNGASFSTLDVDSYSDTYLEGISGGNIVGYADSGAGFLYDGSSFTGIDYPGAATFPQGISGNTIVGYYLDANSKSHGFIANPGSNLCLTLPATKVGNLSATLNGGVNNGSASEMFFQYGTDSSYGSTAPGIGEGTHFTANISGLAPNKAYHYRAVAVVGGIEYYGNDRTVTTEPTNLVLATLSDDAYSSFPQGYLVSGQPSYGYIGNYATYVPSNGLPTGLSVYAYITEDQSQVAVAFRGTLLEPTFDGIENIVADKSFTQGIATTTLSSYAYAAALFVQNVQAAYSNANITVTGHSLGGALALMVGKASGLSASGFNAPGSGLVYQSLLAQFSMGLGSTWQAPSGINPNVNYRIWGDQVSLAGTNFPFPSTTITLTTPLANLPVIASDPTATLMENFGFFIDSHKITTVILALGGVQSISPDPGPNVLSAFQSSIQPFSSTTSGHGQTTFSFDSFLNNVLSVVLNPEEIAGGSDFVFTENSGSPGINAIVLPNINGVSSFEMRSISGSTWSTFQSVQPGTQLPFDPVNGVEVVPVDQDGNPVIETNLVFGIYFASSGTVSGSFVQSSTTPVLPPVPPRITSQPTGASGAIGDNVTFTVAAVGSLPLTFKWQRNGANLTDVGNISGSTTSNLSINGLQAADAGTYSVIVSNSAGSTTSVAVDLQVNIVRNGQFETGDFTGWETNGDFSYTYVDDGYQSGITPFSGGYEAILGTSGSLGYLSQLLPTTTGSRYLLSFLFDNPYGDPGELLLSWNGSTLLDEANPVAPNWTNIQFMVTAAGTNSSVQLAFEDDSNYFGLDDISVMQVNEAPPPALSSITFSGADVGINGNNGLGGETYVLLMSTNLTLPFNKWTPISTNTLSMSGNFTITATNLVNEITPQGFFILRMQ